MKWLLDYFFATLLLFLLTFIFRFCNPVSCIVQVFSCHRGCHMLQMYAADTADFIACCYFGYLMVPFVVDIVAVDTAARSWILACPPGSLMWMLSNK